MKRICILLLLAVWSNGSPMRRKSGRVRFVPIIRHAESNDNEGTYSFDTEGSDGTRFQEKGELKHIAGDGDVSVKSGSVSWTSPEGLPFTLSYTSDENGFHPVGSHLPTSPPAIFVPGSHVEEYEHSYEDYHHQSSSSYLSSSHAPSPMDSVHSPYEEDEGAYSHIEYGGNEFMEFMPTMFTPIPTVSTIPTTFFPTTTEAAAPLEFIVTHPTSRPRPPSVVSISPPAPSVSLPLPSPSPPVSLPLPSPSPSVSVPKPNRPTFIEAPLVPILIGPAPVSSKTFVQTPDFTIDLDATKTKVRIGSA